MDVIIKTVRQVLVVAIAGELDAKTAPEAQELIAPHIKSECKILFDMTHVDYMSSAGLRMFLLLYRTISSHHGGVALVGLAEEIRDTMDMTGFLKYFTTYETLNGGLEALAP